MEPLAATLVVISAFLHALWNAALKRQADPEGASIAILAVAVAAAWAAWTLAGGGARPGLDGAAWSLAAGLCEGGYFVTLALAMRSAPLGAVYTVSRGGALALVWPASAIWMGEAVSGRSVVAAGILGLGLAAVAGEGRARPPARGLLWAAACAGFIAGYHLLYKRALLTGTAPTAVFAIALTVALPLNVARLGGRGLASARDALQASPGTVVAAGLLCTASFLCFLSALTRGGAGAAVTLRNSSIVFALALAWLMGERPGRRQLAGTALVALGAAVLGWPG